MANGPLARALGVIVPTSQAIENLAGFRANPDVKVGPVRFHVVNLLRGRIGPMLLMYYGPGSLSICIVNLLRALTRRS